MLKNIAVGKVSAQNRQRSNSAAIYFFKENKRYLSVLGLFATNLLWFPEVPL